MIFLKNSPRNFYKYNTVLTKKSVTSGASRASFLFKNNLPLCLKLKKLRTFIKNNAGRNILGRVVVFSKQRTSIKKITTNINYKFRYGCISFVSNIIILPYTHKLISLVFLSTGSISYLPTTYNQDLFSLGRLYKYNINLFRYKNKLDLLHHHLFIKQIFFFINQLPKNQPVSLLELTPLTGVKYVRSPGTQAIITKVDKNKNTALVRLPSNVRKVFSLFSIGSAGPNPHTNNKYWKSNKAGYYSNFGKKPRVRGVARNPVDHPHGGRTKAINYPRTPWGKTTKYK